ncbi:hypothetical protein GE09DRAFT_405229 [Coniochaeta sp. 2T2.1]|nr:hypothetical protein GE09DRAFT_405229 [Coniochaeta sp. 2T2.1]
MPSITSLPSLSAFISNHLLRNSSNLLCPSSDPYPQVLNAQIPQYSHPCRCMTSATSNSGVPTCSSGSPNSCTTASSSGSNKSSDLPALRCSSSVEVRGEPIIRPCRRRFSIDARSAAASSAPRIRSQRSSRAMRWAMMADFCSSARASHSSGVTDRIRFQSHPSGGGGRSWKKVSLLRLGPDIFGLRLMVVVVGLGMIYVEFDPFAKWVSSTEFVVVVGLG